MTHLFGMLFSIFADELWLGFMDISIRSVSEKDASNLTRIYNHYVSNTYVTFETEPVASLDMADE